MSAVIMLMIEEIQDRKEERIPEQSNPFYAKTRFLVTDKQGYCAWFPCWVNHFFFFLHHDN